MDEWEVGEMLTEGFARKPAVWILGNHPPRRCGIATFTSDLADAIEANGTPCRVAAMDDDTGLEYPTRVDLVIGQDDLAAYIEAADKINRSHASAVFIQHEFGIFGGEAGSHIVTLLRFLELPVVTTLHTVLDKPNDTQRWITEEILSRSERVVVMTRKAKEILRRSYGRDDNVVVIPHGVPSCPPLGRGSAKRELGWDGRKVLLTFGLISPDKGLDTMIRAMAQIKEENPTTLYVIAGQTHPHIKRAHGEAYRESLENLRDELGLQDRVQFVNRFTELPELCTMLTACDLYVTPYLKMEQITSGTLSYAVGLGRCVVSTPYWHAKELLSQGPGRLVPANDVDGFATTVSELLRDDEARHVHEAEAARIGQSLRWPRIGAEYLRMVADIWRPIHFSSGSMAAAPERLDGAGSTVTRHLERLTDDTGLFQHAVFDIPNRNEGYCTDDNARGLGLLWKAPEKCFSPDVFDRLERTYLGFVAHAWSPDSKSFRNFMSFDRIWLESEGSYDCQARTLEALATGSAQASTDSRRKLCARLFRESWPQRSQFEFPRYCAQVLKSATTWIRHSPSSDTVEPLASQMAKHLLYLLATESQTDWHWFEPFLTYDNARLPESLIEWCAHREDTKGLSLALGALEWLCDVQQQDGYFCPIGNQGFWRRGSTRPQFDQQAIEVWATIDACIAAYRATGARSWMDRAELALSWFYGRNSLGALMVDPETGACADGLERHGPNANRGAESCLSFLGSAFAMDRARRSVAETVNKAIVM